MAQSPVGALMADSPEHSHIPEVLAQHPGGLIWEPHRGRMRITPETRWGDLADDLLPLVREAAQALADPLLPGANIHPHLTKRAARLAGLLEGEIDQVAGRAAAIYMSSIWMGETWDTDRKLRGANDPMGEPLSDAMRTALSELISVLPAFSRQFPSVMVIEDQREAFFAEAEDLTAVKATIEGARHADLIDAQNEAPIQEALAAGAGAGQLAAKGQKTAARSTRNLVLASVVSASIFGFASGEMIGGVGDALGIDLRSATRVFVESELAHIQTVFASAPADQKQALIQSIDKLTREAQTGPVKRSGKVHVVDPVPAKGDFTVIQAAIDAADPWDRIVVREGTYREALRLSKQLEIVGEGDRERILVTNDNDHVLLCDAPIARIEGLRFRREEGETDRPEGYGIWILDGRVQIDNCVVESGSESCVVVNGDRTTLTMRRCLVRDGAATGLSVFDDARTEVEDCMFSANNSFGVLVHGRATLSRCVAKGSGSSGFYFSQGATGVMVACEAFGNRGDGVSVVSKADILLVKCDLHDNLHAGLNVFDYGRAKIEGGQTTRNAGVGVVVSDGAADVTDCLISGNEDVGVWLAKPDSLGVFRNNDLRGNRRGAWDVDDGAKIERSGNKE